MNTGSNIEFGEERTEKYPWIASTRRCKPDVITIRKHKFWLESDEESIFRMSVKVCSHEPIHQILWDMEGSTAGNTYDAGRKLFLNMLAVDTTDQEMREIGITI